MAAPRDQLIPFRDALGRVLAAARQAPRRPPETVSLQDALGRTLAVSVEAPEPHPPFDTSAMDGLVLRRADLKPVPFEIEVSGAIHAGQAPPQVPAGTAVRVMTGAPLPLGADAIVPVEWTERVGAGRIRITRVPEAGQYVRRAGSAVQAGDEVAASGTVITPPVVGALAGAGLAEVSVAARPLVAVIATGDELVDGGALLGPGQIRNTNGPALAAQARFAGADVIGPLSTRDTGGALDDAFEHAKAADVVVLAGGVSMGEKDLVLDAAERAGFSWHFWKVRQRPGKPLAFGTDAAGRLVIGLPGNPVSASVCFEVYVRPLIAVLLGRSLKERSRTARLAASIPKAEGLHTFARVALEETASGPLEATPSGAQGSHVYGSLVRADALAHLPAAWAEAPEGATVEVTVLPWLQGF